MGVGRGSSGSDAGQDDGAGESGLDALVKEVARLPEVVLASVQRGEVVADRFEIELLAGVGGMGAVYKARDRVSGAAVALKTLSRQHAALDERFGREAEILAQLDHPAIVRYVAHGVVASTPYLAMEWLEGEDLGRRLERERLLLGDTITLVRRVAGALAHAHARGVVHRDIKPSNLFLPGGDPALVRVLDFGIARVSSSVAQRVRTRTGTVIGTLGYMAPEQARGERGLDARADLFALGCVLFECLTGRPAFEGDSPVAILAKILVEEPPRVRDLCVVPGSLDELCARMLSKAPERRPVDAAAVAAALDGVGGLYATAAAEPVPRAALTGSELRYVAVVLAARGEGGQAIAEASTLAEGEDRTTRARLHDRAIPFGASIEHMADGSMVVTVSEGGAATDLASRAARCALALLSEDTGLRLAVAMGRAVQGGALPVGEALDRAAALLGAMGAGAVHVDATAAGLLEGRFALAAHEAAYRLLQENESHGTRLLLGKPVPCVGRERELASLRLAVDQAFAEPVASWLLVVGAPGIGKSRVLSELLRGLPADDVWRASGDPLRVGAPLGLLAQLVRRASGLFTGEPPGAAQEKIAGHVRESGALSPEDTERVTAFLAELVGVPFADPSPALRAARADARTMARAIARALEDLVGARSARGPLLIALEDLHWGDGQTVRVLKAALARFEDRPIVVLATARPEAREQFPELGSSAQEIRLGELTRKASEKLVRAVLGAAAAPEMVARICERAAGNAFFLEELIRASAGGDPVALPETVLATVHARFEGLAAGARRVLRAASVFGERFWASGVASLLGHADGAASVEAELEALARDEIVAPASESPIAGEEEHRFRHALLRDAAYAALTPGDRCLGHRLAGEWLERMREADANVLAEHFERGAEDDAGRRRAADAWLRAARTAAARGGPAEAVAHARRGLALLSGLPPGREELSLLVTLGSVLVTTKGYGAPEVGEVMTRAGAIAASAGEGLELGYLIGFYFVYTFRQQLPRARQLASRALEIAEASGDPVLLVEGLRPSWNCAYLGGDLIATRRYAERALAVYDPAAFRKVPFRFLMDPGVNALHFHGAALSGLGYPEQGGAKALAAVELAREIAHPFSIAFALMNLGWLYLLQRRWELAERATAEAITVCVAHELALAVTARGFHGVALGGLGRAAEGLAEVRATEEVILATGSLAGYPSLLRWSAELVAQTGDVPEARARIARAIGEMERTDERLNEVDARRFRGELWARGPGADEPVAIASLREALAIARAREARLEGLRAATSLARLLVRRGERAEARALLAPLEAWFTEGFELPDRVEARAVLAELEEPSP